MNLMQVHRLRLHQLQQTLPNRKQLMLQTVRIMLRMQINLHNRSLKAVQVREMEKIQIMRSIIPNRLVQVLIMLVVQHRLRLPVRTMLLMRQIMLLMQPVVLTLVRQVQRNLRRLLPRPNKQ